MRAEDEKIPKEEPEKVEASEPEGKEEPTPEPELTEEERAEAAEKRATEQETTRKIDSTVFEYATKIDVTDAIDLNDHVILILNMNEKTQPGMATQHVVNQTYDFVQQADIKGAKTIGINIKQSEKKIAQFTVHMDKFVPNDDEPMYDG